jgi:hypothetical protein
VVGGMRSSSCETPATKALSVTCTDAERRANDVFSVFLACLGLSSPWRRRHVVWWWRTRATFDAVRGSHFFFKKRQGPDMQAPKRGEDVRVSLCSS